MRIRLAKQDEARYIAEIHKKEINQGFLSELGEQFLEEFYGSILWPETGFCVVAEKNGQVIGFVAGCADLNRFYKDFFKRHTLQAIKILLPKVFNFRRLRKIIETLLYPAKKEKTVPSAELLTIAIESEFHGQGIADEMFYMFVGEMKKRGIKKFKVLVGESLPRAIRFYEKIGFIFHSKTSIHKGEISRIYIFEIEK